MSDTSDPKEVIEMREALVAFRKAARGVKQSYRNLPRITGALIAAAPKAGSEEDQADDTTKKTLVPA